MIGKEYMVILLGTKNKDKVRELREICTEIMGENPIELISLEEMPYFEEPIEDGNSFYDNALIKAKYYFDVYKIPVITDDSGLVVEALDGKPGIYSARYASHTSKDASDKDNREKLLLEMKGIVHRDAYYQCDMIYYDGVNIFAGTGILQGAILEKEIGNNGFGYDSIFQVSSIHMPLGLLDEAQKNKISHRRNAFEMLLKQIKNKI